jgi:two-component system nitrate/nitrite response regulator NarL
MCCSDPSIAPDVSAPLADRMTPGTIRLVIIGNVRLYREGLAVALSGRRDIDLLGAFECHPAVGEQVIAGDPHVVLIDVAARQSLEVVRALRRDCPKTKLVAFAVDEQDPALFAFAEAGLAGYVTCDASLDDVATILQRVVQEQLVCPPQVTATLLRCLAARADHTASGKPATMLTARETQVLRLIRDGLSNKEIAHAFNISEATVKNHVHHLLEKLHVSSRREAAGRHSDQTQ